jgi:hypothetical protein
MSKWYSREGDEVSSNEVPFAIKHFEKLIATIGVGLVVVFLLGIFGIGSTTFEVEFRKRLAASGFIQSEADLAVYVEALGILGSMTGLERGEILVRASSNGVAISEPLGRSIEEVVFTYLKALGRGDLIPEHVAREEH